jgi:RNA polymerase sigma factor FliA
MSATALWTRFTCGDDAAREALVHEHLGLVHHVARQLGGRLSTEVEVDELVSAGTMGLLHAMSSFDAARGLSFSTYAVPRIRGAILDELRRQDHVPRSVRRKTREMGAARESLARVLGRSPTEREMAAQLGVTGDILRRWELDVEGSVRVPLDKPRRTMDGTMAATEVLPDEVASSIEEQITHEQEVAKLQQALASLKEQERTVLALYYFEELKLSEIADVLGLSACRISQVRTAALAKLRDRLATLRAA